MGRFFPLKAVNFCSVMAKDGVVDEAAADMGVAGDNLMGGS
jgi:hypothetical protein